MQWPYLTLVSGSHLWQPPAEVWSTSGTLRQGKHHSPRSVNRSGRAAGHTWRLSPLTKIGCGVVSAPPNRFKPNRTTTLTSGSLRHEVAFTSGGHRPEIRVKYALLGTAVGHGSAGQQSKGTQGQQQQRICKGSDAHRGRQLSDSCLLHSAGRLLSGGEGGRGFGTQKFVF